MSKLNIYLVLLFLCSSVYAAPTTIVCNYNQYSDIEGIHKSDDFILTFIIDNEKETYYLLGNNGTEKVFPVENSEGISFLEITATGNVMSTTIDSNKTSVHSRHTVIGGLIPSQYYGKCIYK
jgi:hypothetical protein